MKKFPTLLTYPYQAWRLILTDIVMTEDEFGARDNPGKERNTKLRGRGSNKLNKDRKAHYAIG